MKEYQCLQCKKRFLRCPSKNPIVCSRICRDIKRSNKTERQRNCVICNKIFFIRIHRKATNRFCSKKCYRISRKGKDNGNFKKWRNDGGISWNKGKSIKLNNALEIWRKNGGKNYWKGKKRLDMTREKNPAWRGGTSTERDKFHTSLEWKNLRNQVFQRDDYRCMDCGERGGKLEVDHLYQWSLYPRLRLEINNLQTVCKRCHLERTKQFMKGNKYALKIK